MKRLSSPHSTIKDVARAAKVSQATVSYILNNARASRRITEETKQRVWDAAGRLGYRFNPIARALQRGYSNQVTLLVVTWNLATSHAGTAMAISRAAAANDLALTVHVADDDKAAEALLARESLHHLCGILVLWDSAAFQTSGLLRVAAEGIPVIDLLPGSPLGISTATADREQAGFRATRHLIELGHRDIGVIGDVTTRPKTTLAKLAGYRRALESAGIPYRERFLQNVTEFGFDGGARGFRKLIERCPGITALFCINDPIALGAIDAAGELGRACPGRMSVIGYGDAPEGRHWHPKLTTFALSSDQVAARAIQLILDNRSQSCRVAKTILVPGELILRDSTNPPPT